VVRQNALFVHLSPEELDQIAPGVPDFVAPAGQPLYHAEDRPNALFIIRRGIVKQELYLPDGSYRIVRLARRSDLLALEALLDTPCDHTAIALTEVEVCRVPLPMVRRAMENREWMATQMIHHWHQAVQRADGWLKNYSTGSGRRRMACFLGDLAGWAAEETPDQEWIELPSRNDMGAILGITKETASRLLGDFRGAGLVKPYGQGMRYALVDRAGLAQIVTSDS
jgi:CRP-like cAMP-binding protein